VHTQKTKVSHLPEVKKSKISNHQLHLEKSFVALQEVWLTIRCCRCSQTNGDLTGKSFSWCFAKVVTYMKGRWLLVISMTLCEKKHCIQNLKNQALKVPEGK